MRIVAVSALLLTLCCHHARGPMADGDDGEQPIEGLRSWCADPPEVFGQLKSVCAYDGDGGVACCATLVTVESVQCQVTFCQPDCMSKWVEAKIECQDLKLPKEL